MQERKMTIAGPFFLFSVAAVVVAFALGLGKVGTRLIAAMFPD